MKNVFILNALDPFQSLREIYLKGSREFRRRLAIFAASFPLGKHILPSYCPNLVIQQTCNLNIKPLSQCGKTIICVLIVQTIHGITSFKPFFTSRISKKSRILLGNLRTKKTIVCGWTIFNERFMLLAYQQIKSSRFLKLTSTRMEGWIWTSL